MRAHTYYGKHVKIPYKIKNMHSDAVLSKSQSKAASSVAVTDKLLQSVSV